MVNTIGSSQSGVTVALQNEDPAIRSSQGGVSVLLQNEDPAIYSSQTGISAVLCPLPAVATALGAVGYSDHVDLTWTDNVTGISNGYRIERKVGAGAWSILDTVDPAEESYTDNTAAPGSTYTYRVVALNGLCETESAEVVAAFSTIYVYGVSFE